MARLDDILPTMKDMVELSDTEHLSVHAHPDAPHLMDMLEINQDIGKVNVLLHKTIKTQAEIIRGQRIINRKLEHAMRLQGTMALDDIIYRASRPAVAADAGLPNEWNTWTPNDYPLRSWGGWQWDGDKWDWTPSGATPCRSD